MKTERGPEVDSRCDSDDHRDVSSKVISRSSFDSGIWECQGSQAAWPTQQSSLPVAFQSVTAELQDAESPPPGQHSPAASTASPASPASAADSDICGTLTPLAPWLESQSSSVLRGGGNGDGGADGARPLKLIRNRDGVAGPGSSAVPSGQCGGSAAGQGQRPGAMGMGQSS